MPDDVIDFDMCWAFDLADPWGNQYELNCYDYDRIKADLIEADAITRSATGHASCTTGDPEPDDLTIEVHEFAPHEGGALRIPSTWRPARRGLLRARANCSPKLDPGRGPLR